MVEDLNVLKRILDIYVALLLIAPVVLLLSVLFPIIKLDSPGPILFRQTRVGKDGRHFQLIKLRTMRPDTANAASHEVSKYSITRVGAVLRRYKLDEFPQIFCVLRGTMSLVGPRPCLPSQGELIEQRRRRGAMTVLPGITGLAQLTGVDMSRPALLAYVDSLYVANHSLMLDLRLLMATLVGNGRGDAVGKARTRRISPSSRSPI